MPFGCPHEVPCEVVDGVEVCLCPDGCTGKDDWRVFEDSCHVNVKLRFNLHFLVLVLSLMVIVMAIVTMTVLSKKKYGVWWRLQRYLSKCFPQTPGAADQVVSFQLEPERDSQHSSEDGVTQSKRKSRQTATQTQASRVQRHQIQMQALLSFWLVLLFFSFGFCYALYEFITLFSDTRRYDLNAGGRFLDFLVASGAVTCLLALWSIAYKWYDLLPSIRRYGRLLEMNSLLVKYPSAFFVWVKLWAFISIISMMVSFCFLPAANPEHRSKYDGDAIIVMTFIVVVWWVSILYITTVLSHVYSQAKRALAPMVMSSANVRKQSMDPNRGPLTDSSTEIDSQTHLSSNTEKETSIQDKFLTTIRFVMGMTSIGGVFVVFVMLGAALWPPMNRNMYISSSVIAIIGDFAALFLMYFVILRPALLHVPDKHLCSCLKPKSSASSKNDVRGSPSFSVDE